MARTVETDHSRPGWRSRDILKAVAIVLGFWIVLQVLWITRNLVLIAGIGAILGILVSAATDWLARWRIPRAVGAASILLLGLGLFVGLGFAMAPTITSQFGELRTRLPDVLDRLEQHLGMSPGTLGQELLDQSGEAKSQESAAAQPQPAAKGTPAAADAPSRDAGAAPQARGQAEQAPEGRGGALHRLLTTNLGSVREILFPVATATASLVGAIVIILFIALFLAISPRLYREGFLRLLPTGKRDYGREVLREVSSTLKQWALARLLAMIAVGLVVGVSLGVIGVRAALLLGILAGLLELIPFFGPIAAAIPAIGMALLDSPRQALIVAILFVVINLLEGNLLSPLLLQSRVDVPPLLTILAVSALTLLLGFIGALVAEPLIAVAMLLVRKLWVEDHLESTE